MRCWFFAGFCNVRPQQNAAASCNPFYGMSNVCVSCKFANQSSILYSNRIIMQIDIKSFLNGSIGVGGGWCVCVCYSSLSHHTNHVSTERGI